jgi:hypothetical protein
VALGISVVAPAAAATPVPRPTATPSGPSDPCGSILTIVTRPTVTTSVCNVRKNHVLLEDGYTNTITTGSRGGTTIAYPQSFLRIGLGEHVEFDFTPPSYEASSLGDTYASGASDMNFGAKWELGYSAKTVYGFNVSTSTPTGSRTFTAGAPQYTANFNLGYSFNSMFGASGTLGFNSLFGPNAQGVGRRYGAFIPTVEFTGATSGSSQVFAEYANFSSAGPGLGSKSIIDFGYQADLGPHCQFDAEYGLQPNEVNGQKLHYVGAGLSFMT